MKYSKGSILIFSALICGLVASGWAAERVPVFVSIAPQGYFVQQIGKDLVDAGKLAVQAIGRRLLYARVDLVRLQTG